MNSTTTRDFLIILTFALSIFFVRFDGFIVNLAMPTFVQTFGVSAIYNTVMAVTMALGVVLLETIYSEFDQPNAGFTAAFGVGAFCCLAAAAMLGWFVRERPTEEGGGVTQNAGH